MPHTTLAELLHDELCDLYDAEMQVAQSLPALAQAVHTPVLRDAMREQVERTKTQIERLERVFDSMGHPVSGHRSHGMHGLLASCDRLLETSGSDAVRDAAIIAALQRVAHYAITAYGTAAAHAAMIGRARVARLLGESLREEKESDELLSRIAESDVNRLALAAIF
jgi:ferritin-like metal-binding protein YciE